MSEKQYVVGFMFNHDFSKVALIRKLKPAWQKDKLNSVGGSVEPQETFVEAMMREFQEETGKFVFADDWSLFCDMTGGDNDDGGPFRIQFFATQGELDQLKTMEKEKIEIHLTKNISPLRPDTVENLPWLIALAIDHLTDGRPKMVFCNYP